MPSSGIFELSGISGGTGAVRSDDVLPLVDVHDPTQAAQGSLVKIILAQLYRTETTAVTVSTPLPDIAQKWNAGGVTFTAVKLNVTDTASAAASLLIDLQVGGVSKFSVRKDGGVTGLLLTAAQTNVTSVGTLTALTVTPGATSLQALTATTGTFSSTLLGSVGVNMPIGQKVQFNNSGTSYSIKVTAGGVMTFETNAVDQMTIDASGAVVMKGLTATTGTFAGAVSGITTLAIGGALSGVTTLAMGGALSGVTTLNASGLATLGAGIALTGTLTFATAVSKIVPGATSISHRNNADSADNLLINDNGDTSVRGIFQCLTASQSAFNGPLAVAKLVIAGSAVKIIPGNTSISLRNNADSADNLIITDAGVSTFRSTAVTAASATGAAGLNIPHGAAPTSPVNGDMWTTTAGAFIRINGVTKTFTLT